MPNLPWPDNAVAQLSIIGTAFGQQIVNTHHFMASDVTNGGFTGDDSIRTWAAQIAPQWVTSCKTTFLLGHAMEYSILLLRTQVLEVRNNWRRRLTPVEIAPGSPAVGTALSSAEESQAAAVIRWRSALAGKRFRGRSYIGPLSPSHYADGRLNGSAITVMQNYAAAVLGRWGPSGTDAPTHVMCIYSRPFNQGEYGYPQGRHPNMIINYPPDYAGNGQAVIDSSVDTVLRGQRRRQYGVGA
jgi:hypothetical protein